MNWVEVLKTLGSTTIIVAVLGFLAKTIIDHYFQSRIDTHKAHLEREAARELADARARVDRELASTKARADEILLAQKAEFDHQMETFKVELAGRSARVDRIRQEVVRWANPIFGSVIELRNRLNNILCNQGYLALSPQTQDQLNIDWSITYDYFLPSTVYLFCQYFCWVRLLEEKLSFELFRKHTEKDAFFSKVHAVGHKLSDYPLEELKNVVGTGDRQVFRLEQQVLGEAVIASENGELRCLRYSEFLAKWPDAAFKRSLRPMTDFVDGLQPTNTHRWKRLELMAGALNELHNECDRLLRMDPA